MLLHLLESDVTVLHSLLAFIPTRLIFRLRAVCHALRTFIDLEWRPRNLTLVELRASNSSWTRRPATDPTLLGFGGGSAHSGNPYYATKDRTNRSLKLLTANHKRLTNLVSLSCPRVDAELPSLRLSSAPRELPSMCQIAINPPILRSDNDPRLFVDIARILIAAAPSLQQVSIEFTGVARQSACVCRFLDCDNGEGECCSEPMNCWTQLLEEVASPLFSDVQAMATAINEWRSAGNLWAGKVPRARLQLPNLRSLKIRGSCTFPLLFLFHLLGLDGYPGLTSLELVLAEVGPADVFQMHGGVPTILSCLFENASSLTRLKLHRGTWSLNGAVEYETHFLLPSLYQFPTVEELTLEDDTMTESRLLIEGAVNKVFFPKLRRVHVRSVDRTYLLLRNELLGARVTIENVVLRSGLRGLLRYQPGGPEDPETVARMLALHNSQAVAEPDFGLTTIEKLSVELSNSARISEDVYISNIKHLFVWEDYVKSVPDSQPVLPWLHLPPSESTTALPSDSTSLKSITFMSLPFVTMEDLDELTYWADQQRLKLQAHPDFSEVWRDTRNVYIAPQRGFPTCGVWDLCRKTLGDEMSPAETADMPWLNPSYETEGEFGRFGHARKQWHLSVQSLYPLQRHSVW